MRIKNQKKAIDDVHNDLEGKLNAIEGTLFKSVKGHAKQHEFEELFKGFYDYICQTIVFYDTLGNL
jgi:plastocyanin